MTKQRRTQVADGIRNVDVVEDVSRATAAPSGPSTAGATAKRASTRATTRRGGFLFHAEAKCLAEAQIERETVRTRRVIDGDYRLPGDCDQIETAVACVYDAGGAVRARADGRARIVGRVAVYILAGSDVEGRSGTGNHEWADSKADRQTYGAAEKDAVTNIEGSAAIVLGNVCGIGGEIRSAGGIAIGIVQGVIAEKRNREFCGPRHANAAVNNELILPEDTAGFELVVNLTRWQGDNRSGGNLARIGKLSVELTFAARVEIGDGKVGGLRQEGNCEGRTV